VPFDTEVAAHRVQGEIYRRMGGAARLAIAFELSAAVRQLALAGIKARHPTYTEADVLHAWAQLTLGEELARQVWPERGPVRP
jgi:hypothetical protein